MVFLLLDVNRTMWYNYCRNERETMARTRKKHIKLTDGEKQAIANAKIDAGARRQVAIEAGEYDGRFRPRRVASKKRYDRTVSKRAWRE